MAVRRPKLSPEEQSEKSAAWRSAVSSALWEAGRFADSSAFYDCGSAYGSFLVLTCADSPDHAPEVRPLTCKLRYCPTCERREQARKLARYIPAFLALTEEPKEHWSVKHITLTTPYRLDDPDAPALYKKAWQDVDKTLQRVFLSVFDGELTKAERRRQRLSYTAHGVSMLVAAEFGEDSQHLHFHILAYCPFVPKNLLTESWMDVTGGECMVNWIKKVQYHDLEDNIKEICKYVTKFTNLAPKLVPALADVLDGQRRFRTYGKVRLMDEPEHEPAACPICQAKRTLIHVSEYAQLLMMRHLQPDQEIASRASWLFLDLKHGNNSGEAVEKHHDPPDEKPESAQQTRFWDDRTGLPYA